MAPHCGLPFSEGQTVPETRIDDSAVSETRKNSQPRWQRRKQ
jgi:hypothetical protein